MNVTFERQFKQLWQEGDDNSLRVRRSSKGRYRGFVYHFCAEEWVKQELHCPRCGALALDELPPTMDEWRDYANVTCGECKSEFCLIDSPYSMRSIARSNFYRGLVERIGDGTALDIICLQYDLEEFGVSDLFVVPGSCLRKEFLVLGSFYRARELPEGHDTWCDIALRRMTREYGDAVIVDILRDGEQFGPDEVSSALKAAEALSSGSATSL